MSETNNGDNSKGAPTYAGAIQDGAVQNRSINRMSSRMEPSKVESPNIKLSGALRTKKEATDQYGFAQKGVIHEGACNTKTRKKEERRTSTKNNKEVL